MMHFILLADTSVLHYLYSVRDLSTTLLFIDISELGRFQIVIQIVVLISLLSILWKRYADSAGLLVAVLGSGGVILFLKYVINRPRPEAWLQAYPEGPFYSFPSAHAGLAMALYGFLMYLLLQTAPTQFRRILIAILPLLIFLIGFSRLYLGVHYLSDVIVGFAIGAAFIFLGVQVRLRLLKL
jgi:membrane-associated phospholipid phosphatase